LIQTLRCWYSDITGQFINLTYAPLAAVESSNDQIAEFLLILKAVKYQFLQNRRL
jgi:hypothetical protein